jgi:hypothetical protein
MLSNVSEPSFMFSHVSFDEAESQPFLVFVYQWIFFIAKFRLWLFFDRFPTLEILELIVMVRIG